MRCPTPQRLMQVVLLVTLFTLLVQQIQQYGSEPLLTATSRRRGRHPRLTICPSSTASLQLMLSPLQRLANRSINITDFYDIATISLLGKAGTIGYRSKGTDFSAVNGPGTWKEKYYWRYNAHIRNNLGYTRCITFEANESLNKAGSRRHPITIDIMGSPVLNAIPSDGYTGFAPYRLFVHGEEVPNVEDLPEWAPFTESVSLRSGGLVHYSITARRMERVSVRRRPCSSRPGYSKAQCLKECRWRRLAEHTGCRLPHMVGAETFLPEIAGFLDHLPLCSMLPVVETMPLRVLKRSIITSRCMKINRRYNFTKLYKEYALYISQKPGSTSSPEVGQLKLGRHVQPAISVTPDQVTSLPSEKLLLASAPASKPPTEMGPLPPLLPPLFPLPAPPPPLFPPPQPREFLPVPTAAFVFLSNSAFELNETDCRCPDACHETSYALTEKKATSNSGFNKCGVFSTLTFDYTEEVVAESLATTFPDFIAVIGGNIGLFTGFSLFTLAEVLGRVLHVVQQKTRRWRCARLGCETSGEMKKRSTEISPSVATVRSQKRSDMKVLDA